MLLSPACCSDCPSQGLTTDHPLNSAPIWLSGANHSWSDGSDGLGFLQWVEGYKMFHTCPRDPPKTQWVMVKTQDIKDMRFKTLASQIEFSCNRDALGFICPPSQAQNSVSFSLEQVSPILQHPHPPQTHVWRNSEFCIHRTPGHGRQLSSTTQKAFK